MSEEKSPKNGYSKFGHEEVSQIQDNTSHKKIDDLDQTPEDLELDVLEGNDGPKKDLNSVFEKKADSETRSSSVKSKMRSRIAGKAKVVDEEEPPEEMF